MGNESWTGLAEKSLDVTPRFVGIIAAMSAMDLPAFIRSIGVEQAAELFDMTPRAIRAWRDGERIPRPAKAREIVERSKGRVTLATIYGARQ